MALRILSGLLSVLFLYLGSLVYEDEHRALNSRIETLWLRLSYLHEHSRGHELRVIERISVIYSSLLTAIFGKKLVTMRSIASSMVISVGSTAFLALLSAATAAHRSPFKEVCLLAIGLASACLTVLGVFLCRKHWLAVVLMSTTPIPIFILYIYAFKASLHVSTFNWDSRNTWIGILVLLVSSYLSVILSGLCDLTSVGMVQAISRAVLSRNKTFHWIAATLSCLAVIGVTFGLPVLISRMWLTRMYIRHTGSAHFAQIAAGVAELTLIVMEMFNLDLFFFAGVLLFGAILILVHHILWPPLLRGLYLVQDTGILNKRTLLLTMFITFAAAAIWHPESIVKIIEKQIGIEELAAPARPSQISHP